MKIIDAHCHIGNGIYKKQTCDELISRMESNGVDASIVVPVEEFMAVDNKEGNDYILQAVRKYEKKLYGFAVANPWYGKRAVDILDNYLTEGLCGIKFNPAVQGFKINDELVYPLIDIAEKYDVPVYFHTGTPITSIPFQLYDLAGIYKNVNFIMGHCGYSDFWNDVPYIAGHSTNIWFDTSLSLTSRTEDIVRAGAGKRILFGSDSPHSNLPYEISKVMYVDTDEQTKADIMAGNISKLLRLEK